MGMLKANVLPLPNSLSTQIAPPCSSIKLFVIDKPRPVPGCLRASSLLERKNCVNSSP